MAFEEPERHSVVSSPGALDAATGVEYEPGAEPCELPESRGRVFAGKAAGDAARAPDPAGCCPPAEQRACCKPGDKATCCGTPSAKMCGCQ